MEALVLDEDGGIDDLEVRTIAPQTPEFGEIQVAVKAVGLNPVDYKLARNGHREWEYPHVLGLDVAGIVLAIGEGVHEWNVGDPVYYHGDLTRRGGFAESTVTNAHIVAPLPRNRSFVEAAALPCAGLTAYQAIERKFMVAPGESILVHGGSGGVGGFAVQFARLAGGTVYTTCSPQNKRYVHSLGANIAIDYHTESIPERIAELTNDRGVDYVLDVIGGETVDEAFDCLAFGGAVACVSNLPTPKIRAEANAASVHDIYLGEAHIVGDRRAQEDLASMAREVGELLAARSIEPCVTETVSLEEIPDALARLETGSIPHGKVVATIG